MRIFISGGAGSLGSNLVEHFLQNGHTLSILDNYATSDKDIFSGEIEGLTVTEGSVTDIDLLDRLFNEFKPTHVIHAAAAYKEPDNWAEDTAVNVSGTINVCRMSEKHKVRKLVNLQTALCYGRPEAVPIPITAPVAPISSYGISKVAGENYLLMSSVPAVSLRLANIASPRLSIGPIPTFYNRIRAEKGCFCSDTVRDFLDISDFFSVMDLVLKDESVEGKFNISTGSGNTIKDVYEVVSNYLKMGDPSSVPIVPPGDDDVASVVLDPTFTEETLGWKAKVGFEETITNVLKWYDDHGTGSLYSHLKAPVQTDNKGAK